MCLHCAMSAASGDSLAATARKSNKIGLPASPLPPRNPQSSIAHRQRSNPTIKIGTKLRRALISGLVRGLFDRVHKSEDCSSNRSSARAPERRRLPPDRDGLLPKVTGAFRILSPPGNPSSIEFD